MFIANGDRVISWFCIAVAGHLTHYILPQQQLIYIYCISC